MRSIWQSLAWKEWHEHKWKFVAILGALWGTVAISLLYGGPDAFGLAGVTMSLCMVPFAIFVGLAAASNERARGTLAFTQALPAPMWPIALLKLFYGLGILLASVALTLPLYFGWLQWLKHFGDAYNAINRMYSHGYFTGNFVLDLTLTSMAIAASLFIWSAAAGVNRKDEVSAGAVTLATIVGWYVLLFVGGYLLVAFTPLTPNSADTTIAERSRRLFDTIASTVFSMGPGGIAPASAIVLENRGRRPEADVFHALLLIASIASLAPGGG